MGRASAAFNPDCNDWHPVTALFAIVIGIGSLTQAPSASITGAVRDEATGRPLAGAVVTLPDLGQRTTTDSAGRYLIREVPAGTNPLVFRVIGYLPRTIHALVPSTGTLELTVTLRAVPARLQTLVVHGAPAFRGIEQTGGLDPDRVVSMAAARNHPLLAEPDPFLALSGGPVSVDPESPSGVHVRGGAGDHTAYQVDGIPVLSPYHAGGLFSALNPDAVASVRLTSAARTPDQPDALAGVISATTRSAGKRPEAQGSLSTGQARATVTGPLGPNGAGYLASFRSGFPAAFAPAGDASHVRGSTSDWLAALEAPLAGGRLKVLGTGSDNELGVAAGTEPVAADNPALPRHGFEWGNRSLGATWQQTRAAVTTRLAVWSATSTAASQWADPAAPADLQAGRSDLGGVATIERPVAGGTGTGGLRVEVRRVHYRTTAASSGSFETGSSAPLVTGFADHRRPIGDRFALTVGTSIALTRADVMVSPNASLRWQPHRGLALTASYARFHQLAQSARNDESIVARIFPADLYLAGGTNGLPVATSDQGLVTFDYRPSAATRVTAEVYHRHQRGLLLAAPRDARPFAAGAFAVGSGRARGASVEAAFSTARIGVLFSYGIDLVRLTYGDSTYVPGYGATHKLEGGLILFPGPASSIRLGVAGAWGRRGTGVGGAFEWEGCNLIDRGCEFAGSPGYAGVVGGTRLPPYLRVDLGLRHQWRFDWGGRNVQIGLFGTATNLLGRKNVLTYATNPAGDRIPIEMRPLAPLVIGLDWRF